LIVNFTLAVDPVPTNCTVTKLDEPPEGLTKVHQENEQVLIGKLKKSVIEAVITI
jgi:hypothetical protein